MNCLEFHRRITAEPKSRDPDLSAHRSDCPDCAQLASRLENFEQRLRSALEVDPPENLVGRLLMRQSIAPSRRQGRRRWWPALSWAAALLLAVGVTFTMLHRPDEQALDRLVVRHIEQEPHSLLARRALPPDDYLPVLFASRIQLSGELGEVVYAKICPMRDGTGAHLVLVGERGPVTVLVMPGEQIEGRVQVRHDRFAGVILPGARGSIAIVGERGEALAELELLVSQSLRWL